MKDSALSPAWYYTRLCHLSPRLDEEGGPLLVSHKIFIAMMLWTIVSVAISVSAGIEVLATLELIGLLVIRELTDGLLTSELRQRMDIFIYAGLLLFVAVVLRRVWLVVS